jgi:hypothetical protein
MYTRVNGVFAPDIDRFQTLRIAFSDISAPVASKPFFAKQTTEFPAPHPNSIALHGIGRLPDTHVTNIYGGVWIFHGISSGGNSAYIVSILSLKSPQNEG